MSLQKQKGHMESMPKAQQAGCVCAQGPLDQTAPLLFRVDGDALFDTSKTDTRDRGRGQGRKE